MAAPQHQSVDIGLDPFVPEFSEPPFVLEQAFKPEELLGGSPAGWCEVLRSLAPRLPVQLHCEPYNIRDSDDALAQPLFKRTFALLKKIPELEELLRPEKPTGELRRARLKVRLASAGKFIHRNRYRRRQILCCLSGEQMWLFLSAYGGGADAYLARSTNDNWNGFRSTKYPKMLTVEEMYEVAKNAPPGVVAKIVRFRAGDVMMFDGRWWHATSYSEPVLNMFVTPGDDMEVAVKEHKRRMAMPMQKDLKLCSISMAKCSKLDKYGAGSWTKSADGRDIDWNADGAIVDTPPAATAAPTDKKQTEQQDATACCH
jgi:hypothetical protein